MLSLGKLQTWFDPVFGSKNSEPISQNDPGLPEFTSGIAKYMAKIRGDKVKFDPKHIVMAGGANETLISCLANSGDAFLVPAPYYPGFDRDLCWRIGVELVPISCKSSNNFEVTIEAVEEAYKTKPQQAKGKIKGLILTNPSNPLGTILDKKTLKNILNFTNKHKIHLVCNEIYADTVFGDTQFVSIAEIIKDDNRVDKNLVHIVSSLSKDIGFPGFRVGIVYSFNDKVANCARKKSSSGLVSTQTPNLLASMLFDDKFIENFLSERKARLKEMHEKFTKELKNVGIKYLESNAGVYCWVDLSSCLEKSTFEAEVSLWKSIISDAKLNISPGSSFSCPERGWFRICFTNIDDITTLNTALGKIRNKSVKS